MAEEAQNIEELETIDVEITDEKIEKAAVPEHRRVEDEVQEESVNIDLDQNKEGGINQLTLDVDKKWERTGLIFKSSLNHVVWPFYSDGIRITVSGNLLMDSSNARG